MSQDGADLGVGAERALKTVLGGEEQPTEEEKQTPEQMLASIRGAALIDLDYGTTALACARLILEAYERYPVLREEPTEAVYLQDAAGKMVWPAVHLRPGLHSILKELFEDEQQRLDVLSDLTGFMWGWAVNAVRYAMGEPPVPNPAIVEIPNSEG